MAKQHRRADVSKAMVRVEERLAELKREVRREWRPRVAPIRRALKRARRRFDLASATFALLKVIAILALPFVVYVGSSVSLYQHHVPTWLAIVLGAVLTFCVVALYSVWLSRQLVGRARAVATTKWVALPLVVCWTLYSAFYLAQVNAKSDEVRSYYMAVHPILRVALSTVILFDPDLVITDMGRSPEDYARMGLPVNNRTFHYQQADGWVHAIDLRTRGRGAIKNRTVQLYFWLMGFDTLRHVGTADHLHVQLALKP
jgi:hypothetical protein